ncbi:MAG TPA: adenosine deaminase, partial [bacterium]|nr:adenosine deaminase [bacterium]
TTIIELAREYGFPLPAYEPDALRRYVQVMSDTPADLGHILRTVAAFLRRCFPSRRAIARVTVEMIEDAWRDGIRYLEVRFSPWYLGAEHGLALGNVLDGVADGLTAARARYPVRTAIILGMTRESGLDACAQTARLALASANGMVTGVDLSGDEEAYPAGQYSRIFEQIRADGRLGITVHAGEAAGPESVRDAIEILGAHRIGHGVRVVGDPAAVDLVRSRGITLETCPTSNVLTGAVAGFEAHPLRTLLAGGVAATINTDDPSWFDTTLTDEYCLALTRLGLTFDGLRQAVLHAARGAFLPVEERERLARDLATAYDGARPDFAALNLTGGGAGS